MCYCKIFKGQASSIVSLIYKKLCAKFTEFLESRKIVFTDRKNGPAEKVPEEKWNRDKYKNRNKESFYYNNVDFLNRGEGMKYEFGAVPSKEFEEIYGKYLNFQSQIIGQNTLDFNNGWCNTLKTLNDFLYSAIKKTFMMIITKMHRPWRK